jgi:hypothetical protein
MNCETFLITSNLEDPNSELKIQILDKLISAIKHYFKNSFIVLSDSHYVPEFIQKKTNFTIIDNNHRHQTYHGNGELHLLNNGLDILLKYNHLFHYRIGYDFIMNNDNINAYLEWQGKINNQVLLAISQDDGGPNNPLNGCRSNVWFGSTMFAKTILPQHSTNHMESKIWDNIMKSNANVYIYNNINDMFHGASNTYDLIGHAGKTLREEKIEYFKKYYNL